MRCALLPGSRRSKRRDSSSTPLLDSPTPEGGSYAGKSRIDKTLQFIQKIEEKRASNSADIFLVASFAMILVEAFSSSFTMYCLDYGASAQVKAKVIIAYYSLCAVLSFILIINAVLSAVQARRAHKRGETTAHQQTVQIVGEALTISSGLMWITIAMASIAMTLSANVHMQLAALCLAIAAPAIGAISAFLRVYEVSVAYKKERLDAARSGGSCASDAALSMSQNRKNWYRIQSGLFLTIALFEFAHFLCHVYEAYLLRGNTHLLFNIQDRVLLGVQAFLACVFLCLEIAKVYTERNEAKLAQPAIANTNILEVEESTGPSSRSETPDGSTTTLARSCSVSSVAAAHAQAL